MWNEREAHFFIVSHAFICIRKQKANQIGFILFWHSAFFLFIYFSMLFFLLLFFQSRLYSSSSARLCVLQNIFRRVSAESLSSHAGRPGCFALKRDLTFCGKVAHAAPIRAAKRIREIHSASGAFFSPSNLCFECCERGENSQTSRVADEQTSRGGASNLTRPPYLCVPASARVLAFVFVRPL